MSTGLKIFSAIVGLTCLLACGRLEDDAPQQPAELESAGSLEAEFVSATASTASFEYDLSIHPDAGKSFRAGILYSTSQRFTTSSAMRAVIENPVDGAGVLTLEGLSFATKYYYATYVYRLGKYELSEVKDFTTELVQVDMEATDVRFNEATIAAEGTPNRTALNKEFTHALYQMRLEKGIVQYPDANSTMRITYGTVGGYEPYDGVVCDWKTTPAGILEKFNPADYDFWLNDRQYLLYNAGQWGRWGFGPEGKDMYVNFLTDNDITGGNSGSPVLNSRGELIGLAFDGNKESLASDALWTEGYNKCVCVDIRFILWTLDRYAGMTRIIDELGL